MRSDLAAAILYSGDEEKALGICWSLLVMQDKQTAHVAEACIRNHLYEFCKVQAGDDSASVALQDLVEELANRLKRRVPRKAAFPRKSDVC